MTLLENWSTDAGSYPMKKARIKLGTIHPHRHEQVLSGEIFPRYRFLGDQSVVRGQQDGDAFFPDGLAKTAARIAAAAQERDIETTTADRDHLLTAGTIAYDNVNLRMNFPETINEAKQVLLPDGRTQADTEGVSLLGAMGRLDQRFFQTIDMRSHGAKPPFPFLRKSNAIIAPLEYLDIEILLNGSDIPADSRLGPIYVCDPS